MNVLYIVGNRPQFVKLAVLHEEVKKHPFIRESVIHTGQHFSKEMSDVFFEELAIELPIVNLCIHSVSALAMIGRTIEALELEVTKQNPDIIVVFGDTNATLAGAIVAKKLAIPLFHVEAGIRTYEEDMPEESNRYIADRLADVNFCCTSLGVDNLHKEGYNIRNKVINSGDLMLDAYHHYYDRFIQRSKYFSHLPELQGDYLVFTIHRKRNTTDNGILKNIIYALNEINKEISVICPLHPNTKNQIVTNKLQCEFTTIPPVSYLDMQYLIHNSVYVITDSGGIQREAFFAQKPTLILMENPFWPEVIEHGCAINCTGEKQEILKSFHELKKKERAFNPAIFGDGHAARIITKTMIEFAASSVNK